MLVALSLAVSSCAGFFGTTDDAPVSESITAEPDYSAETIVLNVALSDEGYDPETIFLPAGQRVKIVLRNRGRSEHHYRVAGLIPAEMTWVLFPEIDAYDLDSMPPEDLEALGLGGEIDDVEHVLHHLVPVYVPFRAESPAGVKPLANEVHGYVTAGKSDVLDFFPTNTGTFVVEDVLNPEITGRVIVFDPNAPVTFIRPHYASEAELLYA